MKNKTLFIIFIIACSIPLVLADDAILSAREADIDLVITSEFELVPIRANAEVARASAILSWVPYENDQQRVISQSLTPGGSLDREAILHWQNPSLGSHSFSLSASLQTNNAITPVREKSPFPIQELPPELVSFTKHSELINSNDDVTRLAHRLAQDSDDLYEVVFNLAEWVTTNIEYNLTSMTAEATHPSTWVLENRFGVCDELTNLFISLNRALGIPARFVSGLAYTNDESIFADNWGGHGWAEVYFPGVGWVPYDVTYGTYGYVPSGHIKLKDSVDSGGSSVTFEASGRSFNIMSNPLVFNATINSLDSREHDLVEMSAEPFFSEAGFGSYNLVSATLTNEQDHYVAPRISLSRTQGIMSESEDNRFVLLGPYEEKTVHFLVRIDEDLDSEFQYTFPISVRSSLSSSYQTSFVANAYSHNVDESFFSEQILFDEKASAPVVINCESLSTVREEAEITCLFAGKDSQSVSGSACIDTECTSITTPENVTQVVSKDNPGLYTIPVRFSAGNLQTSNFKTIQFVDEVKLAIANVSLPEEVRYDDVVDFSFELQQTSIFGPEDVDVRVSTKRFSNSWNEHRSSYALSFPGTALRAGENELVISVIYSDSFGEEHHIQESFFVSLVELSVTQRVNIWLFVLEDVITSWFN